jgi:hypothetical protein
MNSKMENNLMRSMININSMLNQLYYRLAVKTTYEYDLPPLKFCKSDKFTSSLPHLT